MHDQSVIAIADAANMIVNGYAFTQQADGTIVIVNINHIDYTTIIDSKDQILESSMPPIEQTIVLSLWNENREFMEVANA